MSRRQLRFDNLSDRHVGVTTAIGSYFDEAARVCLGRHHAPPQNMTLVDAGETMSCEANWQVADARTCSAWANDTDATEAGAYGLSLAAIDMMRGLVAVSRAETLTGADYYLGAAGEAFEDLETSYRLEVSGIDRGTDADIAARIRKKKEQALKGASNLPAIAIVVAFSALKIVSEDVE